MPGFTAEEVGSKQSRSVTARSGRWASQRLRSGARFALITSAILGFATALATTFPAVVTEQNLRAVIMGVGSGLSSSDLSSMDLNNDNVVDVADLVIYVRAQGARPNGVNFTQSQTTVTEGDTARLLITIAPGYTGNVSYLLQGTAVCGTDYDPPSGSCGSAPQPLAVSGVSAELAIHALDDLLAANTRTVQVTLLTDAGYSLGYAQQHAVYINDNDAVWQASISVDGLIFGFPLEIGQNGTQSRVVIKSDGSMGLPPGDIAMASSVVTPSSFSATTTLIPVASTATLLKVPLYRRITLAATSVDLASKISGNMSESIFGTGEAVQFTQTGSANVTGTFVLVKPPASIPFNNTTLAPCTAPGC